MSHAPSRPPKCPALVGDNALHVIAVVSNPVRYSSRYRLYEEFAARVRQSPQAHLVTVELAFGDRGHEVAGDDPDCVRLRSSSELWHKENLVNLGVRRLPHDWKYVAWVDADVEFLNADWAQETLHQLQHHPIVQMFEDAVDLGPRRNVVQTHKGFARQYRAGAPRPKTSRDPYPFWHPGFAWACTRAFYESVEGLIDFAALGAADHHMALACIGAARDSLPGGLAPSYERRVLEWQGRALRAADRDMGYVEGALLHHWHGPKAKRYYVERWDILRRNAFDPDADLRRSPSGVLELAGNKPRLRDDLRAYFRARAEDSMEEG